VVRRMFAVAVLFVIVILWLRAGSVSRTTAPTAQRTQIVLAARSQVGRQTDPPGSYCNPYSTYWRSGAPDCGTGERAEPWCADFAAWTWHRAGVAFTYGDSAGQINAGAISFYRWGVAHGTWHPVGSGYRPRPGDVAVYGLDLARGRADHVAVVLRLRAGDRGPDVVNGDGDRRAFSIVEIGRDEADADTDGDSSPLAGYVAPVAP
jgi:hypothetical protein